MSFPYIAYSKVYLDFWCLIWIASLHLEYLVRFSASEVLLKLFYWVLWVMVSSPTLFYFIPLVLLIKYIKPNFQSWDQKAILYTPFFIYIWPNLMLLFKTLQIFHLLISRCLSSNDFLTYCRALHLLILITFLKTIFHSVSFISFDKVPKENQAEYPLCLHSCSTFSTSISEQLLTDIAH